MVYRDLVEQFLCTFNFKINCFSCLGKIKPMKSGGGATRNGKGERVLEGAQRKEAKFPLIRPVIFRNLLKFCICKMRDWTT